MTADATIDYEVLQQEALRGLVRDVLVRVAKTGLPGEHHLYISFDVRAPGVVLSKRLREKYPHEMTIVLQHRFWDLAVSDERFEVKLTFDGIPERLVVPFAAIKVFLDPSVRYVLHFEEPNAGADTDIESMPGTLDTSQDDTRPDGVRSVPARKTRPSRPRPARSDKDGSVSFSAIPAPPAPATLTKPPAAASVDQGDGAPAATAETDKPASNGGGAQVVSLDAFRKK
jgi:uncharacterized protein